MQPLFFDIETRPAPDAELLRVAGEFVPPRYEYVEFDPSTVKLGNVKNKILRDEKIEKARIKHEAEQQEIQDQAGMGWPKLREEHLQRLRETAALNAETGSVITVGMKCEDTYRVPDGDEAQILGEFWCSIRERLQRSVQCVGFNIIRFDLPFLIRRSWALGVPVPSMLYESNKYGVKYHQSMVDVLKEWSLGNYNVWISLSKLHRAFGGEGKDVSGKDFHVMWDTDREAAIEYVRNDLDMTEACARRMNLLFV